MKTCFQKSKKWLFLKGHFFTTPPYYSKAYATDYSIPEENKLSFQLILHPKDEYFYYQTTQEQKKKDAIAKKITERGLCCIWKKKGAAVSATLIPQCGIFLNELKTCLLKVHSF